MPDIGVPELLIVAFIVVLLFGPGKAADLGSALGKGIREFRKASSEEDAPAPDAKAHTAAIVNSDPPLASGRSCSECGTSLADGQKFCSGCGAPATVSA